MKTTRRFATLLVIAVAVVLDAPAPASAGRGTYDTYKLYPAADSPFPHATGKLTLYSAGPPTFLADGVGVSISRLAPNASYYMTLTWTYRDYLGFWHDQFYNVPIQTDAHGNGGGGFSASRYGGFIVSWSEVYDSSGTLVLTLSR